ncbi:pentatricopeptide repeat-containing protein At2g44880 [Aristolochia californica]|uniref:pentatricopeptide repeat-containing protein At2g44880 n=1 Tax=Aristolochia californica TaxID=171875 RepID=UPI0035DC2CD1
MNQLPWTAQEKFCIRLLLKPPKSLTNLLQIYAFILRHSLHSNLSLLSKLISALSDVPTTGISVPLTGIRHARRIFDHHRENGYDAFLCNSMIRAHVQNRQFDESVLLYKTLREENHFAPDNYTFPFLLKACAPVLLRRAAAQLHGHVVKMGFCSDLFVATALVDIYGKLGETKSSRQVFNEMTARTPASWTAVIVAHAKVGEVDSAVELFEQMPTKDTASFNAMIDIFTKLGKMEISQKIFNAMPGRNVVSWTSMISGYCKNGELDEARALFDEMPEKNLFSWNSMIGGYCQNKQPHRGLELFREMQFTSSLIPDRVTLLSFIPAIADLGALDLGRWIHNYVKRNRLDRESSICTALIDMYSKCGEVKKAQQLFNKMPERELASWNAMINGLAINGRAKEALDVFLDMRSKGIDPNDITLMGVLSACSHGGLVEEGKRWFNELEGYGIKPRIEHYGCLVDLLGRAGLLEEAEEMINNMSCEVNGIVLSSLLFACGTHRDTQRGQRMLKKVVALEPWNVGNYVMARNMYAGERRWGDVEELKGLMRQNGAKKEAGCSVIEINSRVWEFLAGDKMHPEWELIDRLLEQLWVHMKVHRGDDYLFEAGLCLS